ncbi:MAG: hypothetical protein PW792_07020 [Acidobacteriaceae bacterium]|nr:hypothetical protein [Acidobacteriaceae bacterium]
MPYLFAITVVAFVAVLWASISTAQHIRRTRRRKRLADAAAARDRSPLSSQRHAAAPPARQPHEAPAPQNARPGYEALAPTLSGRSQTPAVVPPPPAPAPQAYVEPAPAEPEIRFPLSSQRVRIASSTQIPVASAPLQETASQDPFRPEPSRFPELHRPSAANADWNRFDEANGGDLSDPEPKRFRDASRR